MNPIPIDIAKKTGFPFTASTSPTGMFGVNSANPSMFFGFVATSRPLEELLLFGKFAAGLSILSPLKVSVEYEDDGSCLVSDDLFAVYGHGENRDKAIADYVTSLIEYFDLLELRERPRANGSPLPAP